MALCRYYRVYHFYWRKTPEHLQYKSIGIYDNRAKAEQAIAYLRTQEGFCDVPDGFRVHMVMRFRPPRMLNCTFWETGFFTVRC